MLLENILAALEAHRALGLEQKALLSASHNSPAQASLSTDSGEGGQASVGLWGMEARAHGLCPLLLLPESRVQQ